MFRRTLLGMVAVMGLLVVGSGSASAHGYGGHHGGWGHGGYGHGYGYGGYRGYGYGGYGYRAPLYGGFNSVIVAPPVVVPPAYGYGAGCGAYGYRSPYGIGYASPGFGVYMGR